MKLFSSIAFTNQLFLRAFAILSFALLSMIVIISAPARAENDTSHQKPDTVEFSQAELDQILAPIALYPDTILSQVLIAATYPIEVVQADRWARAHTTAKGADAVKLVENKDWDPSVKALVAFPDILQRMSDDVDWTQKLGDAFLNDEGRVMDSVQSLRKKAYASGSLNKVQHLKVQRDDDEIVIEPAEERVVYVPVYDTRVVYGNWWWPDYPPVYWHYPSYTYVSGFYWGPSIFIGPTFFYSSCQWHERHVVVIDRYERGYARPNFYTSTSIVHYEGAREWHHEPIHRRGVAYYNNRLRDDYGSRHESYRDAHVYRDQYRVQNNERNNEENRGAPTHPQTRFDETHRGNSRINPSNGISFATPVNQATNNNPPVDRAEQLRARMQRPTDVNNNNANSRGPERIDRTLSRGGVDHSNDRNNEQNNERSIDRTNNNRQPVTRTETTDHPDYNTTNNQETHERFQQEQNRTAHAQQAPMQVNPPRQEGNENNNGGSRLDRIQQERAQNNEHRVDTNSGRAMRIDDSMTRRVETQRESPRAEHTNNDGGNRMRRGDSKDDDRRH